MAIAPTPWEQIFDDIVSGSRGHAQPTITLKVYGDWVPETVENPLPEPVARNVVVPVHGRNS